MKKFLYPLTLTAALFVAACSNDNLPSGEETPTVPLGEMTPITLSTTESTGTVGVMTKAGEAEQYVKMDNTDILMRIMSKNGSDAKYKYNRAEANTGTGSTGTESTVTFANGQQPYWDDAYGRSAKLTVYAVAVPGKTFNDSKIDVSTSLSNTSNGSNNGTWGTEVTSTDNETINWEVTADQSSGNKLATEDLVYSNNISSGTYGKNGRFEYNFTNSSFNDTPTDGCMEFQLKTTGETTGPGKFNQGHMIFRHALTRITVNLKKGNGFTETNSFVLTNDNISLLGMNINGTLNLKDGTWTIPSTGGTGNVKMEKQATANLGANYTLRGQILPGYQITSGSDTNMMEFEIDDNKYYITQGQVFTALTAAGAGLAGQTSPITLAAGNNYQLTITINKTGVALTATLVEWKEVSGSAEVDNSRNIAFNFYNHTGGAASSNIDLYRLAITETNFIESAPNNDAWKGDYTTANKAELTAPTGSEPTWTTSWYYENNKTIYHFRTVNKGQNIQGTSDTTDDYIEMTSGKVEDGYEDNGNQKTNFTDFRWGAPMTSISSEAVPTYDKAKGFSDRIVKGITATSTPIAITEFHMMSEIHVILKTTDGDDAVTLQTTGASPMSTKVELCEFYEKGKVLMGTGKVETTGTVTSTPAEFTVPSDYFKTPNTETNEYTYRVVPQSLTRTNGTTEYVYFKITTPDNNVYYIKENLSTITDGSSNAITEWLPGHKYIYTFTLKKTGVSMTCTLVEWNQVTGGNQDVTLE